VREAAPIYEAEGASTCGPRCRAAKAACRGRTQGWTQVWLKVEGELDGRGSPGGEREREEGAPGCAGKGRGVKRPAGLDRAGKRKGRGKREKKDRVGWVGRGEEKKREGGKWAGPKRRKGEREKELHSNAIDLNLKFKFK
jgi:hypothetical protein